MNPPEALPVEGVTLAIFQEWHQSLLEYLDSSYKNRYFLPGGQYTTWQAGALSNNGQRILELVPKDKALLTKIGLVSQLARRNQELDDFLQTISNLSNNVCKQYICDVSTSFDMALAFLVKFHDIELPPSNIMDITEIQYSGNGDFTAFYDDFRTVIINNLKKKGSKMKYAENEVLEQDEVMSPTFEEVIILWTLEKIDQKLPNEVNKCFGNQLNGDVTLKDLQQEIFNQIPTFLQVVNNATELDADYIGEDFKEELTDEKEFECDICYKSYRVKSSLTKHRKTHYTFICDVCNMDFSEDGYLVDHISVEHMQDVGLCDICDANISENPEIFRVHFKVHHGKLRHKSNSIIKCPCSKCVDISLTNNKDTNESKDKDIYRCDICDIDFTDPEDLTNDYGLLEHLHMDHMKDTDVCNVDFCKAYIGEDNDGVLQHFKKHHGNLRPNQNGERECHCRKCSTVSYLRKKRKGAIDPVLLETLAKLKTDAENYEIKDTNDIVYADSIVEVEPVIKKIKTDDNIICAKCGKQFSTKKCLQMHKKNKICQKSEKPISCEVCGKSFSHEGHLTIHSKIHTVDTVGTKCTLCGKTVADLAEHTLECRGEKFICSECGKAYANKSSLRNHMKNHVDKESGKTWTCEVCGKNFTIETNLRAHMKIHTDSVMRKVLQCQTCKRKFCHEREMGSHVCKHHACNQCDIKFFKYKNFKNHKRMHDGETVFPCPQCEGIYMNRKMLNAHKRIAHKAHVNKYKCDICPKSFSSTKSLYYHKLVHSGEKPYSCEECGAAFRQKAARDGHYKVHTNEKPFPCSGCDLKFKTLGQVKRHREVKRCGFDEQELFKTKSPTKDN